MGVLKERLGYPPEVVDGQLAHLSGDIFPSDAEKRQTQS
jgi:hypothetical protein